MPKKIPWLWATPRVYERRSAGAVADSALSLLDEY